MAQKIASGGYKSISTPGLEEPPDSLVRLPGYSECHPAGGQHNRKLTQEGGGPIFCARYKSVSSDPLADITELQRVQFVMKGGKVIKNDLAKGAPR
jgi:hypothetical protein